MLPVLPYKLQITESFLSFKFDISSQSKQDLKYVYIKSYETPKLDYCLKKTKTFLVKLFVSLVFFFDLVGDSVIDHI